MQGWMQAVWYHLIIQVKVEVQCTEEHWVHTAASVLPAFAVSAAAAGA